MIRDIEFSKGQSRILSELAEIYNDNLKVNLNKFHNNSHTRLDKEILQLYEMMGVTKDTLLGNFENEFFRYVDLKSNPELITEFELFDIVIIKYILLNWLDEKDWNDLEVANLLIKLDILIELKNVNHGENTPFTVGDN